MSSGYRSLDALESEEVSSKASLMISISAIARPMMYYTGEVSSQTACDMFSSLHWELLYATLSCKILPPQAQIYLRPGPVSVFHKIGFDMGRDA